MKWGKTIFAASYLGKGFDNKIHAKTADWFLYLQETE